VPIRWAGFLTNQKKYAEAEKTCRGAGPASGCGDAYGLLAVLALVQDQWPEVIPSSSRGEAVPDNWRRIIGGE